MKNKIYQFMQGRYGADDLSRFSLWVAVAFLVVALITRNSILDTLALLILVWCYFRMLSKNYSKRYTENEWFLGIKSKVTGFFQGRANTAKHSKEYHIYKCPTCKQKIRVPRGKGKISIHCPKCNTDFIKKS
jgi:DNA-directed RNA polymerase subunit RPC12/RpoP